jgi:hypothetical protein
MKTGGFHLNVFTFFMQRYFSCFPGIQCIFSNKPKKTQNVNVSTKNVNIIYQNVNFIYQKSRYNSHFLPYAAAEGRPYNHSLRIQVLYYYIFM